MPIVLEPSKPERGRGSATGCRTKKVRRRRSTANKTAAQTSATTAEASIENDHGFIGQEFIRWDKDHQTSAKEQSEKRKTSSKAQRTSPHFEDIGSAASPVAAPQRRALALDTRFLSSHSKIGQEIQQEYQSFIETLSHRGVTFDVVASTASGRNDDLSVQVVKTKTPVEAAIPPMEDRGEEGVCLPKTFSAASTWSVFVDLGKVLPP